MSEQRPAPEGRDLTRKTISGLQWQYLATGIYATAQVGFTAIMARLLAPEAFGLIAMAAIVVQFGSYFARMGLSQALVQKLSLSPQEVRAGFTAGVALGLAAFAAVWVIAPLVQALFDEPAVVPVLRAMAATFILAGLGMTAQSLLWRQLRFRTLAVLDTSAYLGGYYIIGVGLALAGAGVWSLVGAALATAALQTIAWYAAAPHSVRPVVEWAPFKRLFGFGSRVSAISLLEFAGSNVDTMVVARFSGAAALGFYNRALMLIWLPVHHLIAPLSRVLFPSFSAMQADLRRLRRVYLVVIGFAALAVLPLAAGVAVASREIVLVVLGPQWTPVIAILPWITLAAAIRMLSHFAGVVCEALADLNRKLVLVAVYVLATGGFLVLTGGRALWLYAAAVAAGELVRLLGYGYLLRDLLDVRFRDVAARYVPALVTAGIVAGSIAAAAVLLRGGQAPHLVTLGVEMAVGGVVLVASLRFAPPLQTLRSELVHQLATTPLASSSTRARLIRFVLGGDRPAVAAQPPGREGQAGP